MKPEHIGINPFGSVEQIADQIATPLIQSKPADSNEGRNDAHAIVGIDGDGRHALPRRPPLDPLCSVAEYEAATPLQRLLHDELWLARWEQSQRRKLDRECQRDYDEAVRDGEPWT